MKRPDRFHHRGFARILPPCVILIAACWFACSAAAQSGMGGGFGTLGGVEPTGQYPPPQYYIGLQVYRAGDLVSAVNAFEGSLRGSRRGVRFRMVDAIPSLAMLAECHYYLGDLETSKRYIDEAWEVAIVSRQWLSTVDWACWNKTTAA